MGQGKDNRDGGGGRNHLGGHHRRIDNDKYYLDSDVSYVRGVHTGQRCEGPHGHILLNLHNSPQRQVYDLHFANQPQN